MFSNAQGKWTLVTLLLTVCSANFQMPMAMYPGAMPNCGQMMARPPPPPVHVAVPVPVPVGIPIPVQMRTTTTTTTTTTPAPSDNFNGNGNGNGIAIAIPVPVPMPVQFAIPSMPQPDFCQRNPKNTKCPVCPPCSCTPCTPSFFSYCSPCHQVCRCKKPGDAPAPMPPIAPQPLQGPAFPMPIPLAMPGPLIMVPYPPPHPKQAKPADKISSSSTDYSGDSSSSCSSSSDSSESRRNKRKRRINKYDIYRRSFRASQIDPSDNELVKPMLSYVAENGDIKINRRLSKDEAAELMDDTSYQDVQVVAGEDSNDQPGVVVLSKGVSRKGMPGMKSRKQVIMRKGLGQHIINKNGKKKLIFRPPPNKKISNLSVSFQVV